LATGSSGEDRRLEDAARAGWLYYVAGNTQDEIARKLGVSRQSAQRLVSLAVSERLIKVRLDHPIARCMELAVQIRARFGLVACEIVPSDPASPNAITGLAQSGAAEIERHLKSKEPIVLALGTGRALKACVDQMPPMNCPHHRLVSMLGNIMSDGSATAYHVVMGLAEKVNAKHFPMPLPVLAGSPEERRVLHSQEAIGNSLNLVGQADATFVGIGNIGETAPLTVDGFVSPEESQRMVGAGAAGEITGWIYDEAGEVMDIPFNHRVAGAPLVRDSDRPVVGIAAGEAKRRAIRAAIEGKLINSLITNENTAGLLLSD